MENAPQDLTALKTQLKTLIVSHLQLVNVAPESIQDDTPLFGGGLGLDSLDAVELVVMLQRNFGVAVQDSEEGRRIFSSVNALAEFVQQRRTK